MEGPAFIPGVTIAVISNNESLKLYSDPDAEEKEATEVPVRYVEAVTGAKFEVQVTLDEGFLAGPCDAARVAVAYDGETHGYATDITQSTRAVKRVAQFGRICIGTTSRGTQQWGDTSFGHLHAGRRSLPPV